MSSELRAQSSELHTHGTAAQQTAVAAVKRAAVLFCRDGHRNRVNTVVTSIPDTYYGRC